MDRAMLTVSALVAGYRSGPVARLPDLALGRGEAALILGPSGSGKTTLLLAIAGLARRFSGAVSIGGDDPAGLPAGARDQFRGRTVGFVFQDLHLIAGLSALDNILVAPFATGVRQDRARALKLLETLGLQGMTQRPAEQLSRGQAQRVAIVRAILQEPKVLLADEPTASLDDEACEDVGALLLRAAAETGAALVIATHDVRLKSRIPRIVAAEPVT